MSTAKGPLNIPNHQTPPKSEIDQTGSTTKTSGSEGKNDDTSPDSLNQLLNKKTKREKINRESCSICRDGGDLLLCDNCPKSFHLSCLKLKETDIPSGNWYCPTCLPKIQKRQENQSKNKILDKENERKRLIKNEKRRLWRLKRKAMLTNANNLLNEQLNKTNTKKNLKEIKSGGNMLIDSFLSNNKIKNTPIKHSNSNICLNFTYLSNLPSNNNQHITKALSLPILFPIPNKTQKKMDENISALGKSIEFFPSEKKMMSLYFPKNDEYKIQVNNEDLNEKLKLSDKTLSEILKCPNSINSLNTLIEQNDRDELLYNETLRKYWNTILQKKNTKHSLKYPIDDKELYSIPDLYGITSYNLYKPDGDAIKVIPLKYISDIIQIYDFIITFSHKLSITRFTMDEFYIALKYSSEYHKEIPLINAIFTPLIRILLYQLINYDLFELEDDEVMFLKIIIENLPSNTVNNFISNSWPELAYLLLSSTKLRRNNPILKNYDKLKGLNIQDFGVKISLDDKISLLKELIVSCYETDTIRNIIKEEQEKRNEIRKNKRDLEEEMRITDSRKRELERQEKFTQPQVKIDQITKRLSTLSEDNQNLTRHQLGKLRKELEYEREQFKSVIKEIDLIEGRRKDIFNKIEKLQNEIVDLYTVNKKYLGVDGRGYQFFYFPWINDTIFIKRLNNNNNNNKSDSKYEWRTLKGEEQIKDLINKLSEKGVKENNLKGKLIKILQRRMVSNKKDKDAMEIEKQNPSEEEIFNNKVLKYTNTSIQTERKPLISEEEYQEISKQFISLEEMITHYLINDNKEWESLIVRENIKAWFSCINDIRHYSSLLKLFNERNKSPYKINSSIINNKNVIIDEEEYSPFDGNGNLDYFKVNPHEELANKIKLWSKDFESLNLEQIYLNYLNQIQSFPMVYVAIFFFRALCVDLGKRRDYYKRKNEENLIDLNEHKEKNEQEQFDFNKDEDFSNNNNNKYTSRLRKRNGLAVNVKNNIGMSNQTSIEKKKGKKMIDWDETCMFCKDFGDLICCEECPNVSHLTCSGLVKIPEVWRCPKCIYNLANRRITRSNTVK